MGQPAALEPRQKDAQQWAKSRGWKDRAGFPGEGALRTFYIPLAFRQRCVCWHTVRPGALSEVEDTHWPWGAGDCNEKGLIHAWTGGASLREEKASAEAKRTALQVFWIEFRGHPGP